MAPSILSTLNFSDATPMVIVDRPGKVRARFADAVRIQLGIAEAMLKKETYILQRPRFVLDPTSGVKVKRMVPVRTKFWMFQDNDGKWCSRLYYGNRPIELVKGKGSLIAGSVEDLIECYRTLIRSSEAGELDKVLLSASKRPGQKS